MSSSTALPIGIEQQVLEARLRQQDIVASFGLFAMRSNDLPAVMQLACEVTARGLNVLFAKVLTYRPETDDLLLHWGVGWQPGFVGHAVLGSGLASPAGFALRTGLPTVSNHLESDGRFRVPDVLLQHGIKRAINVLITGPEAGSKPFGVMEADSSGRLTFTSNDVAFLQSIANVLSATVERARFVAAQQDLLRQKDILIQEVHHRIKNNLQLVQTMLNLQARGLPDSVERQRLGEAAARVMSIAAVHRRLHAEGVVDRVDLASHFSGLLDELAVSLGPEDRTTRPITLDADCVTLSAAEAVPAGLVLVELVTNALKYGAGPIHVSVRIVAGGLGLTVEDSGEGFPPGYHAGTERSLGMRLVSALSRSREPVAISRQDGRTAVTVRLALECGPAV